MDKRDKRVVGAAVAAAIIVAIAVLAVGWFSASRDDAGVQAGDPATGAPTPGTTSTANTESDGRPTQSATEPAALPTQPPQNAQLQGSETQPSQTVPSQTVPSQTAQSQTAPSRAQTSPTGTPQTGTPQTGAAQTGTPQTGTPQTGTPQTGTSQTGTSQGTNSSATDTGAVVSTPGQPATGTASDNLLTSPTADSTGRDTSAPSNSTGVATSDTVAPATPQTAATTTTDTDAPPAGRTILTDDQVAVLPPIMAPSFDVVRVNELGDAVIAGRAAPRSVVIIYDGDREIGRVAADSRGEWVFVSDRPLVPGQHEIGLLSQSGPQSRLSDQVVVLIAPEPRQDIAGQPTEGNPEREKPLALLVPRDEIGATTVLQSPPAVVTGTTPDVPASPAGRPVIASSTTNPSTAATSTTTATTPPSDSAATNSSTSSEAPVSIDVVDYDDSGRLIVSGRSTPQSDVRLYLNNEYVGTARTADDGSFEVQPSEPVEPGVYALRIDEVSPVGSVTARAETPFQRASDVPQALPGHSRIVVQPGNSLWRIARQVYGQGVQYTVIYQANTGQIRNPDLIYPGQIFSVPEMPKDVPAGDPS